MLLVGLELSGWCEEQHLIKTVVARRSAICTSSVGIDRECRLAPCLALALRLRQPFITDNLTAVRGTLVDLDESTVKIAILDALAVDPTSVSFLEAGKAIFIAIAIVLLDADVDGLGHVLDGSQSHNRFQNLEHDGERKR